MHFAPNTGIQALWGPLSLALPRFTRRQNTMKCIALAALAMVLGAAVVQSKVLGVDIGSENIKVTLVQPGRVPISIVTNEMSRRKSPGAVAFHQVRP
jgi:activator of 2-hydroxyglutaryl-CoA dehydratase